MGDNLHGFFLMLHSVSRWFIFVATAWALWRGFSGWLGRGSWLAADRRAATLQVVVWVHQIILGVLLLFVSPLVPTLWNDPAVSSPVGDHRLFVLGHIFLGAVGITLAYLAKVRSTAGSNPRERHRRLFGWSLGAALCAGLILVMATMVHDAPLARLVK